MTQQNPATADYTVAPIRTFAEVAAMMRELPGCERMSANKAEQIHRRALKKLREAVKEHAGYF